MLPVLLIIFNRSAETRKIVNKLREVGVERLYVAADGPRHGVTDDEKACHAARDEINAVDWRCSVVKKFSISNSGSGITITEAINWFFEHEQAGIILEDDCLPSPDFFTFCRIYISKYENDLSVDAICGFNVLKKVNADSSCLMSRLGGIWGWATWRNRWAAFRYKPNAKFVSCDLQFKIKGKECSSRLMCALGLIPGRPLEWDQQWLLHRLKRNSRTLVPENSLITNIGFSQSAARTKVPGRFANTLRFKNITLLEDSSRQLLEDIGDRYDEASLSEYTAAIHEHRLLRLKETFFSVQRFIKSYLTCILCNLRVLFAKMFSENGYSGQAKIIQATYWMGKGTIVIGPGAVIGTARSPQFWSGSCYFEARFPASQIIVGCEFWTNNNVSLIANSGSIYIGNRVLIGEGVQIYDSDFHHQEPSLRRMPHFDSADVIIGDDVWICSGVKVLKGSQIGDGAIIAAGSIVCGKIPPRCIAGGVPAKVLKKI